MRQVVFLRQADFLVDYFPSLLIWLVHDNFFPRMKWFDIFFLDEKLLQRIDPNFSDFVIFRIHQKKLKE